MTTRRERAEGALLGVHAGDSLGATVEFMSWGDIREAYPDGVRDIVGGGPFHWPAGHATDDTDLTRAVLLAHLEPGDDLVLTAANHMLDWLQGDWPGRLPGKAPRDVGNTTRRGLLRFAATRDPRDSGAGVGQAGNGSLMRCIPTAIAVRDRDERHRLSAEISAITHNDPRGVAACVSYNDIVAALLDGADAATAVEDGLRTAHELKAAGVASSISYGQHLKPEMLARTGQTFLDDDAAGFVLDSLSLAVAAVLDPRPFADVVKDIVRIGNDTDTNAAIAGGLVGTRESVLGIPPHWVAKLQFAEEFQAAAARLCLNG